MIFDSLNVDNIVFTILGYPMSYVEFLGTVMYLWSVWLISKRNILTWPIGIVSVLFYMVLFYQIRLYSDTIEQVYYLGASIFGWWVWNKSPKENGKITDVNFSKPIIIILWVVITLIISIFNRFIDEQNQCFTSDIFSRSSILPVSGCIYNNNEFFSDVVNGSEKERKLGLLDYRRCNRDLALLCERSKTHFIAVCNITFHGDQWIKVMD